MALREANMNETATSTTDLSVQALEGERLLVKEICVSGSAAAGVIARVGQRTVGFWRASGALGNHLAFPVGAGAAHMGDGRSLTRLLFDAGLWRGIPVP